MKMNKEMNKYCPKCKSYTKHAVSLFKKGKPRKLAEGTRRYERKKKGYGSQPKPIQHNQVKVTKKLTPKLRCSVCNRQRFMRSLRTRKIEIL